MSGLKEFKVIETALVGFESSSHGFNLSPDIDKGFRVSGSRSPGIFKVGEHEIEFGVVLDNGFIIVYGNTILHKLNESPFRHGIR
jgi:hypothetical protein